jgi:hypothetical protein
MRNRRKTAQKAKPKQSNQKGLELLIPSAESIDTERGRLPIFDPWDTKELLSEAQAKRDQYSTKDKAISGILAEKIKQQAFELLSSLGIKPTAEFDGRKAFLRLAAIHHNVGRLVYHHAPNKAHSREWTRNDEIDLLYCVEQLVKIGSTEREALRLIADEQCFPYHERRMPDRHSGKPSRDARRNALRKKYYEMKASLHDSTNSLERSMGTPFESNFEERLFSLVSDCFYKPFASHSQPRLKRRIFK